MFILNLLKGLKGEMKKEKKNNKNNKKKNIENNKEKTKPLLYIEADNIDDAMRQTFKSLFY
jgi:hypothetical protein